MFVGMNVGGLCLDRWTWPFGFVVIDIWGYGMRGDGYEVDRYVLACIMGWLCLDNWAWLFSWWDIDIRKIICVVS